MKCRRALSCFIQIVVMFLHPLVNMGLDMSCEPITSYLFGPWLTIGKTVIGMKLSFERNLEVSSVVSSCHTKQMLEDVMRRIGSYVKDHSGMWKGCV